MNTGKCWLSRKSVCTKKQELPSSHFLLMVSKNTPNGKRSLEPMSIANLFSRKLQLSQALQTNLLVYAYILHEHPVQSFNKCLVKRRPLEVSSADFPTLDSHLALNPTVQTGLPASRIPRPSGI